MYFNSLQCTALYYTVLYWHALYCTALHFPAPVLVQLQPGFVSSEPFAAVTMVAVVPTAPIVFAALS